MEYPLVFWGIGCLIVAGIFAVAWPRKQAGIADGARYLILRWGHSLVWLFLGLSCFLRALGGSGAADVAAFLALPTYLSFLFVLVTSKREHASD